MPFVRSAARHDARAAEAGPARPPEPMLGSRPLRAAIKVLLCSPAPWRHPVPGGCYPSCHCRGEAQCLGETLLIDPRNTGGGPMRSALRRISPWTTRRARRCFRRPTLGTGWPPTRMSTIHRARNQIRTLPELERVVLMAASLLLCCSSSAGTSVAQERAVRWAYREAERQ